MFRLLLLALRIVRHVGPQPSAIPGQPLPPRAPVPIGQIAGLVVLVCGVLDVAFYFLCNAYYKDRAAIYGMATADHVSAVRTSFFIFTSAVGGMSIVAAQWPRWVGHGLAIAAGLASLVAAYGAFDRGLPNVLGMTLLVVGLLLPALAVRSLARSRAAWAFLVSTCAVYATVLMLGAPKTRGLFDVDLWAALIVPGLLTVGTVALAIARRDYREV